jgi:hypothetical protein
VSVEVISSGEVTAKRRHRCTWCGQWIEAGERYTREFVKLDGDTSWNKLHAECKAALTEAARIEGGDVTYTLYGNERPTPELSDDSDG